jgi:hypothetical protein
MASKQLAELRAVLERTKNELIEAEAELADREAEINAFEFVFEARVGHLMDKLELLEAEIERYHERIEIARNKQIFGHAHVSVDTQFRRKWHTPPPAAARPPPGPLSPGTEKEIRQLYRRLARRFHPDLALDETERARRTRIMAAINDSYAARSLTELAALAQEADAESNDTEMTEAQLLQALEAELARCRRRLREIEVELRQFAHRPSVELSLEVKLARRRGRDLLNEMATEFEAKIARKTAERDMLKAQFGQLGPDQGFIPINK